MAAAPPGGVAEGARHVLPGLELLERFVFVDKKITSPKIYVLQPWIINLLVNAEHLDEHENLVAGQVVQVLSDLTAPNQPGVLQNAALQVSDGSYYIRVVITPEALQAEENAHMQLKLSSLTCRIIVLQKYTVCFQEEARLEDCKFYLTAQRFIVLPMQRQRLETTDGNQEPSVMKKIKELWLKNLAVRNPSGSDPSISQLIDAIGQNQLEILKEIAEGCLDLQMSEEKPVTVTDEIPITKWEAERKKERDEDVFMVPANILLIPPEEEKVACDSSRADTNKTTPVKSSDDRTVSGDPSVISENSYGSAHLLGLSRGGPESLSLSDSLEGSLDNPWNRIPPLSLTLSSSDEKTFQPDTSSKTQKDMVADSNTPDLLEPCSQDSPEGLPQGEPVETTSPSLLCCYSNSTPVGTDTSQAASASGAACNAPCTAQGLQGSRSSQATLPTPLPVSPILPSSTSFSPDAQKPGPAHARTQGGDTVGAKRKLMVGNDEVLLAPGGQQHSQGTPGGRGTGMGGSELMIPRGAKKSRKERGLQHGKELEEVEPEEEPASSSVNGPRSRMQKHRALEPYVRKPARYKYKAPSRELCQQIQSIRISEAMLKWACWVLTAEEEEEEEDDS